METGGQGFNFHAMSSQAMNSEDNALWIGSGSFNDPLIESSQAIMQTAERRKRQNCGYSPYGHPQSGFGGSVQAGLGSNLTLSSEGNVSHFYGPMFSAQGPMTQGSNGVMVNPPVTNSRDSFHPSMSDERRNSYKRKNPMDGSAGVLTSGNLSGRSESDFGRLAPLSGTGRLESSMNHAYGDPQFTWDSHNTFQHSRFSPMPRERANRYDGLNAFWTSENYRSPSIANGNGPSQALMPRRMPPTSHGSASNVGVVLPEALSFRRDNSLSDSGTWCANNTFGEEANSHSGFGHEENQSRNSSREVVGRSQTDSRLPQPPIRTSRSVYPREFNSQASYASHHNPFGYGGIADIQPPAILVAQPSSRYTNVHPQGGILRFPPPGLAAALINPMSAPEALYGDAYPSFTNTLGQAPIPRYNDTNRASHVHQVFFHGQQAVPLEGINRHQFAASHELINQSLIYNGGDWADVHDHHSDMRLDVDDMSYEELLALEERIGNVSTGLSEDDVDKCLKSSKFSCCDTTSGGNSEESDLKCSICQEEYLEGDQLGQLDCGHGYHTACIKQWLALKSLCPICKAGTGSKA